MATKVKNASTSARGKCQSLQFHQDRLPLLLSSHCTLPTTPSSAPTHAHRNAPLKKKITEHLTKTKKSILVKIVEILGNQRWAIFKKYTEIGITENYACIFKFFAPKAFDSTIYELLEPPHAALPTPGHSEHPSRSQAAKCSMENPVNTGREEPRAMEQWSSNTGKVLALQTTGGKAF